VLVDDGSRDDGLAVAKQELQRRPGLQATLLSLSRNFGKEAALTAGLEAARGDVVVPLDADLQDPPELIEPMLEQWRQGFDVVYAVRRRRAGDHPHQTAHRLWLLPVDGSAEQHRHPRRHRRLPPDGPLRGGGPGPAAGAQPLHEGAVRLGGLPPDGHSLRPRRPPRGIQRLDLLEALELCP
ncbi:MAG: glycosyltransferase, partial [Synechococcaceae bacterium WBB_10_009]|nr:glycosyltransferase [Synechococcaceae bacterium WBB_10_009]